MVGKFAETVPLAVRQVGVRDEALQLRKEIDLGCIEDKASDVCNFALTVSALSGSVLASASRRLPCC